MKPKPQDVGSRWIEKSLNIKLSLIIIRQIAYIPSEYMLSGNLPAVDYYAPDNGHHAH